MQSVYIGFLLVLAAPVIPGQSLDTWLREFGQLVIDVRRIPTKLREWGAQRVRGENQFDLRRPT